MDIPLLNLKVSLQSVTFLADTCHNVLTQFIFEQAVVTVRQTHFSFLFNINLKVSTCAYYPDFTVYQMKASFIKLK